MSKGKWEEVKDGDYVEVYCDSNIYKVYCNDYGKLYIDFRGEERTLESFEGLLYKVYSDEEIFSIGRKL